MRKDMSKVLVERSRLGGKYNRKGRKPRNADSLPSKQGMRKVHKDRKSLNENLSPLKRYLHSQVGRPWDQVYSEISEHLKPTNAVQQHVRDHVKDFVQKDVLIIDDIVKVMGGFRYGNPELRTGELYVCPKSGILKKYKRKKEVKRTPFNYLMRDLNRLSNCEKSKLSIEDGEVFKIYKDKISDEWSVKEKATPIHAKNDYFRIGVSGLDEAKRFFKNYADQIDLNDPYFATYLSLLE